ncbi:acyl-CoA reductase-like NAD-dependent aldehyde dehydrogenase [Thermocatellispora tengchongensis]|uniref:Acyl-CoA reductase-like NAD-dependent aldehyde dehydrogenase n=1 Tax=Thermocatellispora tengchongensis TaxID=1073253 RepID=A0A840PBZ5_9ACTN|nr:aldehyde dehydrogenase family protein [Thermocatellispora tengchongensis]MBB5133535.1 acyl-CoA reductase-like NAD-dependent aldehyde dehydrogenase [Thermocatellispora tengchongensis]
MVGAGSGWRREKVGHFIGGEWTPAGSGRWYPNLSPWSGHVLGQVAAGDAEDAYRAIEAAHEAFAGWAAIPPSRRQQIFLGAAGILESRREEILHALAAETGCGRHFGDVQLGFTLKLLRQAAQLAYRPTGELLPSDVEGTQAMAVRRPVGVVGAIAPWNASLTLSGRAIVGPLALGNTVVLKPSEEAPYTGGALWAEILQEAGLPPGALNVVAHAPGEAGGIGDAMLASPLVRRINFTGSTPTGRRLAEKAGRHLKRVVLQLSGQNPLIIARDADVGYAVDAAAYGAFVHQGQVCMCARRIYVERPLAEEFGARFAAKAAALPAGDPSDPATVVGPVINEWALALLDRRVNEAVELGARVLAGGVPRPPCYPATVLAGVPDEAEIAQGETFGPVVILEAVDSAEEAVARANASDLGLAASVITGDTRRGLRLAARLDAGIVHVNDQPVNDEPQMPFGGVKDTGWGRFGLGFAAEEFCDLQWVTVRDQDRAFPF